MEELELKTFLETVPPGKEVIINNFCKYEHNRTRPYVNSLTIELHCTNEKCQGIRFFKLINDVSLDTEKSNDDFLYYYCCNCSRSRKTFALHSRFDSETKKWVVSKYAEEPSFGPPTPAKAITLIGGEKDLFMLGRRCENQGMGIGAFVYYRRVIESQKNRIFDELIRVISKISPNNEVLKEIEAAKKETQFTTAVEKIKHALPQSLFINGYNPLTLLHSALSEGVHEHDDAECLEFASSIRTVLFEFADRLGNALKEEANLNEAINKLANKKLKAK